MIAITSPPEFAIVPVLIYTWLSRKVVSNLLPGILFEINVGQPWRQWSQCTIIPKRVSARTFGLFATLHTPFLRSMLIFFRYNFIVQQDANFLFFCSVSGLKHPPLNKTESSFMCYGRSDLHKS